MHKFVQQVRNVYETHRNSANAIHMEKYMKNKFEYLGIKRPQRNELNKSFFSKDFRPSKEAIIDISYEFWDLPEREYQYFAMDLLGYYKNDPEKIWISDFEKMITMKSWWDTVDYLAVNMTGTYFLKYFEQVIPVTQLWMDSENIWLQRTCILFQLKYKKDTKVELLDSFILHCNGSKEFFINKAIGWALREYSKTNPEFVKNYVEHNDLNPLSKREALKVINRSN